MMWKVVWLHVLYVTVGSCTCVYYLFNSYLLPKSGKSSKTTPTSSIKPSDVYRRKGDKFQYIRRIL